MPPYTDADFQAAMQAPDPRTAELRYLQAHLDPATTLRAQSQSMEGTVFTEQGPMEVRAAIAAFGVGTVQYRFGTWVVTEDGVACLVHHYPLPWARLAEAQDWASHLAELPWVNLWDLLRALAVARQATTHHTRSGPHGEGAHPS